MTRYQALKYLTLIIFVLPMFYSHFTVLPGATKYVMDLVLVLYFFLYRPVFRDKGPFPSSGFKSIYATYVLIVLVISAYSVIIHSESFVYWFQEFRRLVYPLLFYIILSDVFTTDSRASIKYHSLMFAIYMVQVPITFVQRNFQGPLRSSPLYSGGVREIHELDFATGTLGGGGASFMGVMIPMVILYFYDLRIFKWALLMIIPLISIFSGGGVVLTAIAVLGILLYGFVAKPIVVKAKIIAAVLMLVAASVVLYSFPFFSTPVNKYMDSFAFYNENYVEGGRETFVTQEHKIDRLNGYKFLLRNMNEAILEPYLGLGFSFKENNGGIEYQFKSDFNFMIAERGFVGLGAYALFFIFIMMGILRALRIRKYDDIFIKLLYFAIFFIAGFYNIASRSYQMWLMFIYFLILLENKEQYFSLKLNLHENKRDRRWKERRTQVENVSQQPA